jgi:hypothetical protein
MKEKAVIKDGQTFLFGKKPKFLEQKKPEQKKTNAQIEEETDIFYPGW